MNKREKMNKLTNQIFDYIGSEENKKKLRETVIDPLVEYFKKKLQIFYVIITFLLLLLIIINIFMCIKVCQNYNCLQMMSSMLKTPTI